MVKPEKTVISMSERALQVQQPGGPPAATQGQPASPTAPPKLTAQQQAALAKATREGNIVRTMAFPAAMASALPIGNEVGRPDSSYISINWCRTPEPPTDPVERMLLEQLALAHQRVAKLHAQAEEAKMPTRPRSPRQGRHAERLLAAHREHDLGRFLDQRAERRRDRH